jgi:hypothetical protein
VVHDRTVRLLGAREGALVQFHQPAFESSLFDALVEQVTVDELVDIVW